MGLVDNLPTSQSVIFWILEEQILGIGGLPSVAFWILEEQIPTRPQTGEDGLYLWVLPIRNKQGMCKICRILPYFLILGELILGTF